MPLHPDPVFSALGSMADRGQATGIGNGVNFVDTCCVTGADDRGKIVRFPDPADQHRQVGLPLLQHRVNFSSPLGGHQVVPGSGFIRCRIACEI